MSFESALLGNLRGNGVLYVICVIAIIGAFKVLDDYPKQKKFVILGSALLMAASIIGGVVGAVLYDAIVGQPHFNMDMADHQKRMENMKTYSLMSNILHFVTGAAHAAGVGFILYAVFVGKFKVTPARSRRRRDYDDDDDDRGSRRRRRDQDEDDEDDRRRRRRSRDD